MTKKASKSKTKLQILREYRSLANSYQRLEDAVFDIIDGNRNFRNPEAIIAETGVNPSRADEIFEILREISKKKG